MTLQEKIAYRDAMKDQMDSLPAVGEVVLHNPEFIPFSSTRQMIYRYGLSIGLKLKIKHRNGKITVSVCNCRLMVLSVKFGVLK